MVSILTVPEAQVRFDGLDLNGSSELLFSATTEVPGFGEYSTLFLADIPGAAMRQLTVFPERIQVDGPSGVIQVQNRFGLFRTVPESDSNGTAGETDGGSAGNADETVDDASPGETSGDERVTGDIADYSAPRPEMTLRPVEHFPAFVHGRDIQTGKTMAIVSSPDGRFLTYLVPDSPGYGTLTMYDTVQEREVAVSEKVELTLDQAPLKWSGDSSYFVYSKGNEVFYYSIEQYRADRGLNEELRLVGPGTVDSVSWIGENTLYYVRGSLVYRIRGTEFFARSLYQELLKIGTIVGKLPAHFDANFDRFWVSPDGEKILLSTDGRNITVMYLDTDDFGGTEGAMSLPYLFLPRNTRLHTVLWSPGDTITLLAGSIRHGVTTTAVYRLDMASEENSAFTATQDNGVIGIDLAPDASRAIVW
ncbi:MAG: hypothetical protein ACOC2V_01890, partial [Alkalispirochaeta sp.]